MNESLLDELQSTKNDLLAALNEFPDAQFNVIPFEGSWTAGQTTQHTLLAVAGLPEILRGNTKPTERNPEANVKMLRNMFLDFEQKYQSPEAINPPNQRFDKERLTAALDTALSPIINFAETEDLSVTCVGFEFPTVGELTRIELINFASVHTIRHTHQLKTIKELLVSTN